MSYLCFSNCRFEEVHRLRYRASMPRRVSYQNLGRFLRTRSYIRQAYSSSYPIHIRHRNMSAYRSAYRQYISDSYSTENMNLPFLPFQFCNGRVHILAYIAFHIDVIFCTEYTNIYITVYSASTSRRPRNMSFCTISVLYPKFDPNMPRSTYSVNMT